MEPIKPRHFRWPLALAAVFVPGIATGALTIPHVFTAGSPIRAAEVNANFDAVRQKSDSIEAGLGTVQQSVSTLQGQVADLSPLPARVTALEGQVTALQSQVTSLQALVATKLTAGHTFSYVDTDQGIVGTTSSNIFVATPTASRIVTPTAAAGTYLLVWYAEYGRTANGGGNRVLARLRNVTQNTTVALSRRSQGIENTGTTALPADSAFSTAGDLLEFSGAITLQLTAAQAAQTFELQYAINNNTNSGAVIRVQRQRLDLVRVF